MHLFRVDLCLAAWLENYTLCIALNELQLHGQVDAFVPTLVLAQNLLFAVVSPTQPSPVFCTIESLSVAFALHCFCSLYFDAGHPRIQFTRVSRPSSSSPSSSSHYCSN